MNIKEPDFKIVYQGDLRTLSTHLKSNYQIETDAPTDNQGKGSRFSPTDLLCISLASCKMTIMGIKAQSSNIDLRDTQILIKKTMSSELPRRISEISIVFHFHNKVTDTKHQATLRKCAETCPVKYSIHPDIKVNTHFEW